MKKKNKTEKEEGVLFDFILGLLLVGFIARLINKHIKNRKNGAEVGTPKV